MIVKGLSIRDAYHCFGEKDTRFARDTRWSIVREGHKGRRTEIDRVSDRQTIEMEAETSSQKMDD
jgi:hypothetical protein